MTPETLCNHMDALRIYARYLTRSYDTAQELTQDVALQILLNPDKSRDVNYPAAYLKTALRNRFLDQRRRAIRTPRHIELQEAEIIGQSGDHHIELAETLAALQQLPADQRQILQLRIQSDMSYEMLAKTLDLPLGTIMSRLNRARTRLRQMTS